MPTPPSDVVAGAVATSAWANSVADALQAMIGDLYAGAVLAIPWGKVTGKPATFAPAAHTHADAGTGGTVGYAVITGKPATFAAAAHAHTVGSAAGQVSHDSLTGVSVNDHHDQAHGHDGDGSGTVAHADLTGLTANDHHAKLHTHNGDGSGVVGAVAWAAVTGKPATFAPAAHKASHSTGGTDALTPANIGAWKAAGGGVTIWAQAADPGGAAAEGDVWIKG